MKLEDAKNAAKEGLEALREVYGQSPQSSMKGDVNKILITDFFTDVMHLLGHAETTRLFDRAGDHWEEERAK